jgi:tRNA-(ms[2]io[6]A)-hydroxylase
MLARDIPYVKITASRYAKGMLMRTHEPLTLIDKLICGAISKPAPASASPHWRRSSTTICRSSICRCCARKRHYQDYLSPCPAGERQRYLTPGTAFW